MDSQAQFLYLEPELLVLDADLRVLVAEFLTLPVEAVVVRLQAVIVVVGVRELNAEVAHFPRELVDLRRRL